MADHTGIDPRRQALMWVTVLGVCLLAGLLLAGRVTAASPFRLNYSTREGDAKSGTVIDGRVFNDLDRDVLDVWVAAEALGASGKPVASGITFVGAVIRAHSGQPFVVKVPFVEGVQGYRVSVRSYRDTAVTQSP